MEEIDDSPLFVKMTVLCVSLRRILSIIKLRARLNEDNPWKNTDENRCKSG